MREPGIDAKVGAILRAEHMALERIYYKAHLK